MVNFGTSKLEIRAARPQTRDPHMERYYEISIETLPNQRNVKERTSIFSILQVIH